MNEIKLIPARRVESEFFDHNSRFIATAGPAFSVNEAQRFFSCIKNKYPDADHHVPAFLIGHGESVIAHCSDDGEPSGTAGRPALAVLQGSGLGDIAVVVTRYFGGTKLGTGGLVRAYSDSVRQVLDIMPQAKKVATTVLMFVVPYTLFERSQLLVNNHCGVTIDQIFGSDVTLTVRIISEYLDSFKRRLIDLANGNIEFIVIEERKNTIMPLRNNHNG